MDPNSNTPSANTATTSTTTKSNNSKPPTPHPHPPLPHHHARTPSIDSKNSTRAIPRALQLNRQPSNASKGATSTSAVSNSYSFTESMDYNIMNGENGSLMLSTDESVRSRSFVNNNNKGFSSKGGVADIYVVKNDIKIANITLEQVKSPYENEAEQTILSAIEDAEKRNVLKTQRLGVKKDRDNILSQVPAKSMRLFMTQEEKLEQEYVEAQNQNQQTQNQMVETTDVPALFSLGSIEEKSHSVASKARFTNLIKKVITNNNNDGSTTRKRFESTGESSLIFHNNIINKDIPHTVHSLPPPRSPVPTTQPRPTNSASSPHRNNSTRQPKLFAITDQLIGIDNLERQKTVRNLTMMVGGENKNYSTHTNNKEKIDIFDPESLIARAEEDKELNEQHHSTIMNDGNDNNNNKDLTILSNSENKSTTNDLITSSTSRGTKTTNTYTRRCSCFFQCCLPCIGFYRFMKDRRRVMRQYFKVWFIVFLLTYGIALLLFYVAKNPTVGDSEEHLAWILMFVLRQSITFFLAKSTQLFVIDYIAMETSLAVKSFGRTITLLIILSKGWPSLISFWGIWNFILIYGKSSFAQHWCFGLGKFVDVCNPSELSSGIPYHPIYRNILTTMVVLGLVVMIKRLFVSLLLGKKKYVTYGPKMEKLMKSILLVSEIAMLAEEIEFMVSNTKKKSTARGWLFQNYNNTRQAGGEDDGVGEDDEDEDDDEDNEYSNSRKYSDVYEFPGAAPSIDVDDDNDNDGDINNEMNNDTTTASARRDKEEQHISTNKSNIFPFHNPFKKDRNKTEIHSMIKKSNTRELDKLLGRWTEPEVYRKAQWQDTSIHKVLQFRESLKYLDGDYPLSVPFGLADNRKSCCRSAEKVYERLLMKTPESGECLNFETLSVLAIEPNGTLDKDKVRALIRLLRPDREGNLTSLNFLKSMDRIYRRARVFRATTLTSAQLDDAFEQIINIIFYTIIGTVIFLTIGVKTDGIVALSGAFLSLSFMFGGSASRFLEGLLLVLARQPYDVGDRIAISNPTNDTSTDGSTTWYVENITLFQTTVRMAATNEFATYSNSSLSHCRIINAARSPRAITYVYLKFGIDVPYSKVMIFKDVVEKFVRERPREYIGGLTFRAVNVEADVGYIKYVICLQHVESWQNIGDVLNAKAKVASFCLEVQKKMDMRFIAPPMPVDLSIVGRHALTGDDEFIMNHEEMSMGRDDHQNENNDREEKSPLLFPPSSSSKNNKSNIPTHRRDISSMGYQNLSDMFEHK